MLFVLLGIKEGDLAVLLMSGMGSGCGDGGGLLTVDGSCNLDKRLSLLASVGLIVRAPRPLIRPDCRLLALDEGVVSRWRCDLLLGVRRGLLAGVCSV